MRPVVRGGRVWQRLRRQVFARDSWRCVLCGVRGVERDEGDGDRVLEVDHLVEVADGGDNSLANLRTVCRECHRSKTTANIRERARSRRGGMKFGEDGWPIADGSNPPSLGGGDGASERK